MTINGNQTPRRTRNIQEGNPHTAVQDASFFNQTNSVAFRAAGTRHTFCWPEVFNSFGTGGYPTTGATYFAYPPLCVITTTSATKFRMEHASTVRSSLISFQIPWLSISGYDIIRAQVDVLTPTYYDGTELRLVQASSWQTVSSPATGNWVAQQSGFLATPPPPGWLRSSHVTGSALRRFNLSVDITSKGTGGAMAFEIEAQQSGATFYSGEERKLWIRSISMWEESREDTQ